jgi:type IV pilus assembly protein PilW
MKTLRDSQRGFSLVELMVAIAVALFLVAGVVSMLDTTRKAYKDQGKLSQLQDDQRLAMTLITNVVQSAGYYPDPLSKSPADVFKLGAVAFTGQSSLAFAYDGQSLTGATNSTSSLGDSLVSRFATSGSGSDNLIDCTGLQWKVAGVIINTITLDTNNNLLCGINGAPPVQLVNGVTRMQVSYGLKTDYTIDDNQVDMYVPTGDMQPADWPNVICLRLTLTFKNPLYKQGDLAQPETIDFTRVITVMNKAGVKT